MPNTQASIERVVSSPFMHLNPQHPLDDQDHIQNHIDEAVNAEKQLWKLVHVKGLLNSDVQELYNKARSSYAKILFNDHELGVLQDVEYSLWKLHYKHIDEYRNRIRESLTNKEGTNLSQEKNIASVRQKSENFLEGFKSFLSKATEFYQDLIVKVRRSYGFSGEVLNDGALSSSMDTMKRHRCQFSCHRYLVCLGDLARYRELYLIPNAQNRSWSVAATYYLKASIILPDGGNPQNQLALLAIYIGDELLSLYHCIRSLAVEGPFPDAWNNLILLFDKNRSSQLHSLCNEANFDFFKPFEGSTIQIKAKSSNNLPFYPTSAATRDVLPEHTGLWSLVVRIISFFYVDSSFKDFPCIFGSTIRELEALLSLDDERLKAALESYQHMGVDRTGPFRVLQLVTVLIFTIHMLTESSKLQIPMHIKNIQQPSSIVYALASAFIYVGRLVNRSLMANHVGSSPLLPAILVFVEWLMNIQGTAETYVSDEICASAIAYFFDSFVKLLNRFDDKHCQTESMDSLSLWEDTELRGFSPIMKFNKPLDCLTAHQPQRGFDDINECEVRIHRFLVAGMKIANRSIGSKKWIIYEEMKHKFCTAESMKLTCRSESVVKDDYHTFDMQRSSSPVEEEEVILFKPIIRQNSAPLYVPKTTSNRVSTEETKDLVAPSGEHFRRASSLKLTRNGASIGSSDCCSNIPSSTKAFWQEPIPEDSVMDTFNENSTDFKFGMMDSVTDGLPSPAGPPSLSAWVLDKEKWPKDSTKNVSRQTEDVASAYITSLSIGESVVSQQDHQVAASGLSSNSIHGEPSWREATIDHHDPYSTDNYMAPPHVPPLPSAPLLPADATWFTNDSSNGGEHMGLETMRKHLLGTSHASSCPDLAATDNANTPMISHGYRPFTDRIRAAQLHHQYQENLGFNEVPDSVSPLQFYTPMSPTPGRFRAQDFSRFVPSGELTSPSVSDQIAHLENPPLYPGFYDVNGAEGQKKETPFHGYPISSPRVYNAATDLRSEQLRLLQYLKEKEWHLQREAQLRSAS